jgi:hypothetical protein
MPLASSTQKSQITRSRWLTTEYDPSSFETMWQSRPDRSSRRARASASVNLVLSSNFFTQRACLRQFQFPFQLAFYKIVRLWYREKSNRSQVERNVFMGRSMAAVDCSPVAAHLKLCLYNCELVPDVPAFDC